MAGQQPLKLRIMVRIHASEPKQKRQEISVFVLVYEK